MNSVWLLIHDINAATWAMELVTHPGPATRLSSGNAQQANRGADIKFPDYTWEVIPESKTAFVVRGNPK